MIKIICAFCVAIASVFTFTPSIDVVSASSLPITNSVNATGNKSSTNLLGGVNNMYYAYTSNWNVIKDVDSTSQWTATGLDIGPATGVAFVDSQPNIALVVWSQNGAIPSNTPISFTLQYQQTNVSVAYLQGNTNRVVPTLSRSDTTNNLYYTYSFYTTQWTDHLEFRFKALSTTDTNKFIGAIFVGSYDTEISFDVAYNEGYSNGVTNANNTVNTNSASYNAGYETGVTDSFNVVNTSSASYNAGYSAGLNNADKFSFMSLISSVIDAPVQAFKGLLNFEILGVNVSAFVLGLFSVGLLIAVFKFLIR